MVAHDAPLKFEPTPGCLLLRQVVGPRPGQQFDVCGIAGALDQPAHNLNRQAVQLAEQWLKCLYLQKSAALTHRGTIAHINSSGFAVRLDDSGIEGFVDTRQLPEKYSFDASSLRLSTGSRVYQLEQSVDVAVAAIDLKKRSISLQLLGDR